jgi:uncharacterized damage-inducible protein DinB
MDDTTMDDTTMTDKDQLHHYLRVRRASLLYKLEGLSDYDVRRPITATGTNLLGLVKHVASVQLEYFGEVFGRPSGRDLPWMNDDAPRDADFWATAEESRDSVIELHHFSAAHTDAAIDALELDAVGTVPWWPEEKRAVTLLQILTHMVAETSRHAGHADIVRELIDGSTGDRPGDPNLSPRDAAQWAAYRAQLEAVARVGH